jgi:hypothetical protein
VTAVGGMVVAATAVMTIYGAAHLGGGHNAALGSPPPLNRGPISSVQPSDGGNQNGDGPNHGRNDGPGRDPSTTPASPTESAPPSSLPPVTDESTAPSVNPSTGTTDPTTGPTDPTTGPTDPTTGPTDPVGDDVTFLSDPPVDPKFGDTYRVRATSASGKSITFSVDGTPSDACTLEASTDVVTFAHAGTCVITAHVQNKAVSLAAGQGDNTQQIDIPKAAQDITFAAPGDAEVDGSDALTATSTSGLAVDLALDPSSDACGLDGDTVTYLHARDCTITATQPGNRDYLEATPVTRTFAVGKGTQSISFTSPADATVGGGSNLEATSSSGATVSFDQGASPNGACTVTGSTVTFDHARDCTVTMSAAATDDYHALQDVTRTFTIGKGTPHLDFALPATANVKGSDPLAATSSDSDGEITYSVGGDGQVCTLNQTHTAVRYHQVGACTVTATLASTDDYLGATSDQTVTIVGHLSVSAVLDPNPTLGALFGYHHVDVTVDGLASETTATLTGSSSNARDVVAVGGHCGSLLRPARTCSVTFAPEGFDWYVDLGGATWADVTFTATSPDGETASEKVRVYAWPWE